MNQTYPDYEPLPGKSQSRQYRLSYLVPAVLSATLNSFLCGYQIGVFNTCQNNVAHSLSWGSHKTVLISVMTMLMPLGAMLGSMVAGLVANRLGRKWGMMLTCGIMVLSAGLNVISSSYSFGVARFLGGIVAGMGSTIPPVFVKEIVPVEISGVLGSLVQFQITLGIVVSYAMGIPLPYHNYGDYDMNEWWRALFLLPIPIACIQVLLLLLYVRMDTPAWLYEHNRGNEAEKHIRRIYSETYAPEAISQLKGSLKPTNVDMEVQEAEAPPSYSDLFTPKFRKGLFLACGISLFQQLCGINTFIFYSSRMFNSLGGHESMANVYTTILGVVNMASTLLSLPFVDKLGRKILLLQGCAGMVVSLGALGVLALIDKVPELQLIVMLFYVAFFETSLGPICWIYASEVLPDRGVSIVLLVNWIFTALVGVSFPFMSSGDALHIYGAFWVYGGLCVAAFFFVLLFVMETKGLTREEIHKRLAS